MHKRCQDAGPRWRPARFGPGEQRRKLRRGAAAFEKLLFQPPLVDRGGLDFDFNAGAFKQKPTACAFRGEHRFDRADP